MKKTAKRTTKTADHTTHLLPDAPHTPPTAKTPQRRGGDVPQAWQRAKLEPAMWPFPAPMHGKAGLTWAVLPSGAKVKWSDLGMDRRLEGRLKVWLGQEQEKK